MAHSQKLSIESIDALLSGATPQFSMQLKARLWAMIQDLPASDAVRVYGEQQMLFLDDIAFGTTRGRTGAASPDGNEAGWKSLPSHPHGS